MSRSYRKAYWTQGYGGQGRSLAKREASKKIRKARDVGNFGSYKRIYNSWDICDFKFYEVGDSERTWRVKSK